jgi:hypothetical protein
MTKPLNTSPSCVGSIDSCMEHHSKNSLRAQVADAHDVKGEREASSLTSASVGFSLHETRSLILRLTVLVGNLCSLVLQTVPLDPAAIMVTAANAKNTNVKQDGGRSVATSTSKSSSSDRRHVLANSDVRKSLAQILSCLLDVSASASINLETAVLKKMELNRRKYPVDLCKVCLQLLSATHFVSRKVSYLFALLFSARFYCRMIDRERLENTLNTATKQASPKVLDSQRCI